MSKPGNDDTVSRTGRRNQSGNANMKKGLFQSASVKGNHFDGKNQMNEISKAKNPRSQPSCTFCMCEISCPVVCSRTKLMNILIQSRKLQGANVIFEKLIEEHRPSLVTYTSLINALTMQKCFKPIHSIVSQVGKRQMKLDSIFFNALINAFAESGNMEDAHKAFQKMKESGLRPTTNTYTMLIKGYEIAGKPDELLKLLDLISTEGNLKPDLKTYNILVRAWCKLENMSEARNVVYKMSASGMQPIVVTFNTIATAYAQNRKTAQAEAMILEMERYGLEPNERTCNTIISGYCREGKMKEALQLVFRMMDIGLQPNLIVFNSLVHGFADKMDRDGVDEVLKLKEEFQIQPDVVTYSIIMNACSQAGFLGKCKEIYNDMLKAGVKPNAHIYGILAKGYVRAQQTKKAEELLPAMVESGVLPNVVIFTTVISGWCSAGRMDNALRVFDQMREFGVSPNFKTFEDLIWGYAEAKQPQKSEEILQIMEAYHVQPKKSTILLVAEAWHFAGCTEEANAFLSRVKTKQMTNSIEEDGNMPAKSSEKIYQADDPFSSLLQLPFVGSTYQKGSALAVRRNRRLLRDADLETPFLTKNFKCHPQICGAVKDFPLRVRNGFKVSSMMVHANLQIPLQLHSLN